MTEAAPQNSSTGKVFVAGWVIVAFTFIVQFMCVGTSYYVFSTLLDPIAQSLETTRFQVSLALSLQTLLMAFASPIVGRLVAERPIKLVMSAGVVLISIGLLLLSQAQTLWQLYVAFGLVVGTGFALCTNIPCNTILANWWVARRGRAMGFSQLGITFSAVLLVPLASWLILQYGWPATITVFGLGIPALLLPLIWLCAVKTPEERGFYPDGAAEPPPVPAQTDSMPWTLLRALRDRRVVLLTLIFGPCFMTISGVVIVLPTHSTDLGFSIMEGANLVVITTVFGALAKPLFGTLADRLPLRIMIAAAIGLSMAGIATLAIANSFVWLAIGGALFGLGYGPAAPLWAISVGALFDRASFARVMGLLTSFTMPFNLVGLPFSTAVYGATGSYAPGFFAFTAVLVVPLIAVSLLRVPAGTDG
ncbi:MAG: MFS transporter [Pseudomonadota bacterium]